MPFTIRTPGPADADRIAELHVETWRETYTHLLPAPAWCGSRGSWPRRVSPLTRDARR